MKKSIFAPCKINLQLDIGEKKDNYHNIYTIMQTVSLYDTLTFNITKNTKNIENNIILTSNSSYIPTDEKNLCYKAIKYFVNTYNITDIINLHIKKVIPLGAGLGGGSSDFFYTLNFLNKYYKTNLSIIEMQNICNQYGSDISFFSVGGTCICEGRGEIIKKIKKIPSCFILLINPNIHISTKDAYEKYDLYEKKDYSNKKEKFLDILENKSKINIKDLTPYLFNAFEDSTIIEYEAIKNVKDKLMQNGAITSLMSGSGSTVYGIFNNFFAAKACQLKFIKTTKYFNIICKPI